jgi:hypothetical protein
MWRRSHNPTVGDGTAGATSGGGITLKKLEVEAAGAIGVTRRLECRRPLKVMAGQGGVAGRDGESWQATATVAHSP